VYATPELVVAMNKAQLETLAAAGRVWVESVQRLVALNSSMATLCTNALLASFGASGGGSVLRNGAIPVDLGSNYAREVMEIFQAAQNDMVKLLDGGLDHFSREALEAAEKSLVHGALPGGEMTVSALRNALGAAISSMDAVQIACRHFTEATDASPGASALRAGRPVPIGSRMRAA
jgi:hypothetical protein